MSLPVGVPAPVFLAPSPDQPQFAFGSLGGRYVVLLFLPPPGKARRAALTLIREHSGLLNDNRLVLFGVLPDAESFAQVKNTVHGLRWFDDRDGHIRQLYAAVDARGELEPQWVVIDPSLRIFCAAPLAMGPSIIGMLSRMGLPEDHAGVPLVAPILIVPRVLEAAYCQSLIETYEQQGGLESGVMQVQDGKTVGVLNDFKRRRDASIPEGPLTKGLSARIKNRLAPEIEKAFQFTATRIERYIVACYDAGEGGYFMPHRDNTTPGTAHRRFAVSINLNDGFEGGDLRFPEYGPRTYRPPVGGAVVFSCSLLHEATPVTRGRRYATLPFLYDEAAALVREANRHTLVSPA